MRTWHALVLLLSCGCSLDTNPRKSGASDAGALAAVSFDVWRRVSQIGGLDAAVGDEHADAGAGEHARDGAADSGKPAHDTMATPREPAARDGAMPARPTGQERDPGQARERGAGSSAAPAAMRLDDELDAGLPGSQAEAAGGQSSAADGGGMDAALPAQDAATPEAPDTPELQAARARVLELVGKTLDNAFGPLWTPDAIALSATVRSLAGLPENQRTRPLVAGVLIRLRATNACRFDNPDDCRELCSALDRDCAVCRWDTSCQVSVSVMCAPQQSFSCDPWQ